MTGEILRTTWFHETLLVSTGEELFVTDDYAYVIDIKSGEVLGAVLCTTEYP